MSDITIKNADEISVTRYGVRIESGESVEVPADRVLAYSAMEIALSTQVIARRVSRATKLYEEELQRQEEERRVRRTKPWVAQRFYYRDPLVKRVPRAIRRFFRNIFGRVPVEVTTRG